MMINTQLILNFLSELKNNNHKAWMDTHKKAYEKAKKEFELIVQQFIEGIALFDTDVVDLEPKSCIFRLNRDIRFSSDKTPYKINFGASIQKGGKKSNLGGYYVHIQPEGESFLAGGIYMPMPEVLMKVRQEIDYNFEEFKDIVENETFKKYFTSLEGEKVKTTPKGYDKENPAIEYLKYKSFIAWHKMTDTQVLADNFIPHTLEVFKAMKPLNDFLNKAIEH